MCKSLQAYNEQIKSLKQHMDAATESANRIRGDIATLRNRSSLWHMAYVRCPPFQTHITHNKHIQPTPTTTKKETNAKNRSRCVYLSANQKCELSRQPVLGHPFYCFPCNHVFLQEYLIKEVWPQNWKDFVAAASCCLGPRASNTWNVLIALARSRRI